MKTRLIPGILFCCMLFGVPGHSATTETGRLIVRDVTGKMSQQELEKLAARVESTLTDVLRFWSAEPRVSELGKIIIEFDHALPKTSTSVFYWGKEKGQRVRVVSVFGGGEHPHLLAHKLTSAVFPNPDKLIRNMMGEASEMRFGNPLAFPMCGFNKDAWVAALLQAGSYIPLAKIGPEHRDWGMEIVNNAPEVKDRAKQHASYLEAGSFGEFLITTYGTEKMKQFNRASRNTPRPWEQVFGSPLEALETGWLRTVRAGSRENEAKISTLLTLLRSDPGSACFSAQKLAEGK